LAKTKEELVNYPTLIWLNGGPGTSSHLGNFMEIGPIFIMADGTKVVNKYSWNTKYNIMFVDNPIAVGYSYAANKTEIPVNQD
jgi:carboxypeptidase C (cathepsin A)